MLLVIPPSSFTPWLCYGVLCLTLLCQLMSASVHQIQVESPDTQISSQGICLNWILWQVSWLHFFFLDQIENPDKSQRNKQTNQNKKPPATQTHPSPQKKQPKTSTKQTNFRRSRFFFLQLIIKFQLLAVRQKSCLAKADYTGEVWYGSVCRLFCSNEGPQESTNIFFWLTEMSAWNPISSSNTECMRRFMGSSVCGYLSFLWPLWLLL